MCRAREVGESGFCVAACELKSLLDLSLDEESGSTGNGLTTGYHVSLFYGLQLSEAVEIGNGVTAVPLEQTSAFLVRDVLQGVAPSIARENRWKAVSAMLQPVRWKPTLLCPGDDSEPQLDWDGSFFEDMRAFVALLSVSHGVPIVTLMDVAYCIDRTVLLLLGKPYYHGGYRSKSWTRGFSALHGSHQLDIVALDEAKEVFRKPDRGRYQEFARVVSRLSEALARTGQYAADDRILDVAIALEQMYELDEGEISFKLKIRAACFLESTTQDRLRVFKDVEQLYEARSSIVHARKKKRRKKFSAELKNEVFQEGL